MRSRMGIIALPSMNGTMCMNSFVGMLAKMASPLDSSVTVRKCDDVRTWMIVPIEKSRLLLALLLACLEVGSVCYGFQVETCAS